MTDSDFPEVPLTPIGPWAAEAKCAGIETNVFFPPHGGKGKRACEICAECPVRADCLEYALAADEEFGIWGGLDPRERRNLKRRRARQRAAEAARGSGGVA